MDCYNIMLYRIYTWPLIDLTLDVYHLLKFSISSKNLSNFVENKDSDLIQRMLGICVALFGNSTIKSNKVRTTETTGSMIFPV